MEAAQDGTPIHRLLVVGDVNSTMAATVASAKLNIPVAHVEAGLRSFDRIMPEEINRILTDAICDMLLVSEPAGVESLKREGHPDAHIHLVGNVMIDTLLAQVEQARARDTLQRLSLEPHAYGVITLHRPSNVDRPEVLGPLVGVLVEMSSQLDVVFPIHPRTMARLEAFGLRSTIRQRAPAPLHRVARLSRLPVPDIPGQSDGDGLRRLAGGVHGAGRSLPHHAEQHGMADHLCGGNEHIDWQLGRAVERASSASDRRQLQAGPTS